MKTKAPTHSQSDHAADKQQAPTSQGVLFSDQRVEARTQLGLQQLMAKDAAKRRSYNMLSPTSAPAQLATRIQHTSGTFSYLPKGDDAVRTDETVGVNMRAQLDPNDKVIGSSTGEPQTAFIQALRATFPQDSMIRGHLLNHDLGGFGVHENLFPITGKANSKHLHEVEKYVKNALYDAHQEGGDKGVYYSVNVTGDRTDNMDNPKSTFNCVANWIPDVKTAPDTLGAQLFDVKVESAPKKANRGQDYQNAKAEGAHNYTKTGDKLSSWKHGGRKGKLNFDTLIGQGKIAISTFASKAGGDGVAFATKAEAFLYIDEHEEQVVEIITDLLALAQVDSVDQLQAEHYQLLLPGDKATCLNFRKAVAMVEDREEDKPLTD